MSLIKWNPNHSILSTHNGWHNFLDEFFGNSITNQQSGWIPNVDIHENKKDYSLTMDLPGLSKKNVEMKLEDNVLTISGERSYVKNDADACRLERGLGKFDRSFNLPDNINVHDISASFKNGELFVILPKTKETISKSMDIKIS